MKTKILTKLKPQAASLGFNAEELEGVAAQIADNLGSEDATDEDIDGAINSTISYLKVAQKVANRTIEAARKKATPPKTTEGADETEPNLSGVKTPPKQDDEPEWFKNYRETQEKRIAAIEGEKVTSTRKSQLEAIVKDAGTLKSTKMKDFSRMRFETDEEFNDYLEDTKSDVTIFLQEQANKGLSGMGKPNSTGGVKTGDVDPILKERIKEREAETVTPAIAGLPQVK